MIDSIVFLWIAFGSLDFIEGQIIGKLWTTVFRSWYCWPCDGDPALQPARRRANRPGDRVGKTRQERRRSGKVGAPS